MVADLKPLLLGLLRRRQADDIIDSSVYTVHLKEVNLNALVWAFSNIKLKFLGS
jgi:hypothetical protein